MTSTSQLWLAFLVPVEFVSLLANDQRKNSTDWIPQRWQHALGAHCILPINLFPSPANKLYGTCMHAGLYLFCYKYHFAEAIELIQPNPARFYTRHAFSQLFSRKTQVESLWQCIFVAAWDKPNLIIWRPTCFSSRILTQIFWSELQQNSKQQTVQQRLSGFQPLIFNSGNQSCQEATDNVCRLHCFAAIQTHRTSILRNRWLWIETDCRVKVVICMEFAQMQKAWVDVASDKVESVATMRTDAKIDWGL